MIRSNVVVDKLERDVLPGNRARAIGVHCIARVAPARHSTASYPLKCRVADCQTTIVTIDEDP